MFQTCPVKIIRMHASSRPTFECGKERDHPEHEPGQEAEHRDALPDVEQRDHHLLRAPRVRGDGPVDEREDEREQVRREPARERQERVAREGARDRGRSASPFGSARSSAARGRRRRPRAPRASRSGRDRRRLRRRPGAGVSAAVLSSRGASGRRIGTGRHYRRRPPPTQRSEGGTINLYEIFRSAPVRGGRAYFPISPSA